MSWKLSGSILLGAATTLALLYGCSSDDEGSSTNTTGDGGMGGSGTGASSSTGGADATTGGSGGANLGGSGGGAQGGMGGEGGSIVPPVTICEEVPAGMGGAPEARCETFPAPCGDVDDYAHARFGTDAVDSLWTGGNEVIFALGDDDDLQGYATGACIVGGEGDDRLTLSSEGSAISDVGIGGPGTDTWQLYSWTAAPATLADVEADETIRLSVGAGEGAAGDKFVEIIESFGGTSAEMTKDTTRAVYDPTNGKIWYDADGNVNEASPVHIGTVANADEVELTVANFLNP